MSQILNDEYQSMAANAICHAASMAQAAVQQAVTHYEWPHVIYKPTLGRDGDQWCALLGSNLQEGIAGFGDSPARAMGDFDRAWKESIPKAE